MNKNMSDMIDRLVLATIIIQLLSNVFLKFLIFRIDNQESRISLHHQQSLE